MKGATIKDPMTIYHITNIIDDKIQALCIYVHDNMVQGLDYIREFDNDIPPNAILLPEGTYFRVKESMKLFIDEMENYLRCHCIRDCFKVKIGGHYWERHIITIKSMEGNKTKYDLFRLESENISPYWTGEGFVDSIEKYGVEVTDETFNEVKYRYTLYVKNLKESHFKIPSMKQV